MDRSFFIVLIAAVSFGVSSAGFHTLQYHTDVTLQNATTTGKLDGETFVSYSSGGARVIPMKEWIKKMGTDVSGYWKSEKARLSGLHDNFQEDLKHAEKVFGQTKGGHTLHWTYTCELSDDNTTNGSLQVLYDGKDFFWLNLKKGTWSAADSGVENFLSTWKNAENKTKHWTHYLNSTCPVWLQRYLNYSNSVSQGSNGISDGGSDKKHIIISVIILIHAIVAVLIVCCMKKKRKKLKEIILGFLNRVFLHKFLAIFCPISEPGTQNTCQDFTPVPIRSPEDLDTNLPPPVDTVTPSTSCICNLSGPRVGAEHHHSE